MNHYKTFIKPTMLLAIAVLTTTFQSFKQETKEVKVAAENDEQPKYFLLKPELEKLYGYSHAVTIGDNLKKSGASLW